jgi:hypothetical protein
MSALAQKPDDFDWVTRRPKGTYGGGVTHKINVRPWAGAAVETVQLGKVYGDPADYAVAVNSHGVSADAMTLWYPVDTSIASRSSVQMALAGVNADLTKLFGPGGDDLELLTSWDLVLEDLLSSEQVKQDAWDLALREIDALEGSWNGPDSVAPSQQAKDDVRRLVQMVRPSVSRLPEFEIDDSAGSIALTWSNSDNRAFLSFVIRGDGHVSILARANDRKQLMANVSPIEADKRIASVFRHRDIAALTSAR